MSKITITIELDAHENGQKRTVDLLDAISSFASEGVELASPEPAKKEIPNSPGPKKEEKPKKETAAQKKKREAEEAKAAQESEKNQDDSSGEDTKEVKIADVRALLSDKIEGNREGIKAKLSELGAPNVSSLKPEKYKEMYDYLASL